jgi:hypothetical protein
MWIHDEDLDGTLLPGKPSIKARDHDVYKAVLMDRDHRGRSKIHLVRQRTFAIDGHRHRAANRRPAPVWRLLETVPELLEETVTDFLEKNGCPIDIEFLEIGFPCALLPDSETRKLFSLKGREEIEAGYRNLLSKYHEADGLITLSRVGFDQAQRQAIMVIGRQYGPLCGAGSYIVLESRDGVWSVVRSTLAWIS